MLNAEHLNAEPDIVVTGAFTPGPDAEAAVAEIWSAEQAAAGRPPFDGEVFSVSEATRDRITGCFVPYRYWLAQCRRPDLRGRLGVAPLAVSGLLRCADGVVFGRRAGTTQAPGLWELVPSGGVDRGALADGRISLALQLATELREEIGLDPAGAVIGAAFCLVEDTGTGLRDIGIGIATELDGNAVLAAHRDRGSDEYDALDIVPDDRIRGWAAKTGDDLVGVSRCLLEARGLL